MPHAQLVDRNTLARELTDLADRPPLAARRDELRALADDLRSGDDLDQWAEVDLLRAYARPDCLAPVTPPPRRHGVLRRLVAFLRTRPTRGQGWAVTLRALRAQLRGGSPRHDALEALLSVLVFVPLLVTWLGLREATHAYGRLAAEDPRQATRPFLQLWQTGFGGRLAPIGRFDNVAGMAILLIGTLVLVAIWHARARGREERERDLAQAEQEVVLSELAAVLTRVQLALVPHRQASPQQFTGVLAKAARRLESVGDKARDSQQALTQAADAVTRAAGDLRDSARRLVDGITPLRDAADRIETAVRTGQAETAKAGTDSAQAVRGVSDRVERAATVVEKALRDLTTVQRELVTTSQTVVQATDQASRAMRDSSAHTDQAVADMRRTAERWDAAAAHWQDAAARLDTSIQTLAGARPRGADTPPPAAPGHALPTPPTAPTAPTAPIAPTAVAPQPAPRPGPDTGADVPAEGSDGASS